MKYFCDRSFDVAGNGPKHGTLRAGLCKNL